MPLSVAWGSGDGGGNGEKAVRVQLLSPQAVFPQKWLIGVPGSVQFLNDHPFSRKEKQA